ncbi:MAG: hypothetical protein AAGE76_10695 [Pseudomonadota bacterium]
MRRDLPGIGHNKGPAFSPGHSWRRHCWRRARADLVGRRLPLEILRTRVARARELGLAYPTYASILLGSGRDIVGFLYTCDALGLRLRRRLEMPEPVRAALGAQVNCTRLALAPEAEVPEAFRQELEAVSGLSFAAAGAPPPPVPWRAARTALRALVAQPGLPPRGVVLVGTRDAEAAWADAADLARFLPADEVFGAASAS